MADDLLLEVTDLAVHFPVLRGLLRRHVGTAKAVDGVSFTVPRARTFGLVGESGSGKSTTARAILRLVDITAGTVRLDGRDITELRGGALRRTRRRMQMIFQDPYASLNPRMTLLDIIAEPLRTHGLVGGRNEAATEVGKLMDRVGLPRAYLKRFPHELSGGQRQRVGIARAAALGPQLIVADEPVSALDMSIRAQIINLLTELQEALGVAYLLIAHDLAVVRHVCHEIGVMYLGRIVERATARRLFAAPSHPYTQALLSAIPVPDPVRERARRHVVLTGEPPSAMAPPSGCAFHTRCPLAEDVCRTQRPELEERAAGHWVACHLDDADVTRPGGGGAGMTRWAP
ncbi:MAG: ATP-binding cassette domain-containing protein [Deltaproteobacteria bacterium]|nr:ATP-binding cassette domain-containing protein [Deltaproteobacteria bacterium]